MSDKKYTVAETGPMIEDFLKPVLDAADFDVEYVVAEGETPHPDFENPEVMVKFSGPDVELLLANKAEVLLALEQLTQEALHVPSEDHSRICFDANDRRAMRIEELRMSALTAAERVRKTHAPFHFSPMNSRERRILHLSLRNEEGVRSESVGEGPDSAGGDCARGYEDAARARDSSAPAPRRRFQRWTRPLRRSRRSRTRWSWWRPRWRSARRWSSSRWPWWW